MMRTLECSNGGLACSSSCSEVERGPFSVCSAQIQLVKRATLPPQTVLAGGQVVQPAQSGAWQRKGRDNFAELALVYDVFKARWQPWQRCVNDRAETARAWDYSCVRLTSVCLRHV
jgi:hypothetical protein